jgi:hypothetical protein
MLVAYAGIEDQISTSVKMEGKRGPGARWINTG